MMIKAIFSVIAVIFFFSLVSCNTGPSESEIAASVEASLAQLLAETTEANKTPTIRPIELTPSPSKTARPSKTPTPTRVGFYAEVVEGGKQFLSCASFGCKPLIGAKPGEVHYFFQKNRTWCETDINGVQAWIFCNWIATRTDTESAAATAEGYESSKVIRPTATATATPRTLDLQTQFNKCVSLDQDIKYVIMGSGVRGVSLTYENDTRGTNQGDFNLPFCKIYRNFNRGDFLYISAQIIEGSGDIICQIYDGNTLLSEAAASGRSSIASCSASAP